MLAVAQSFDRHDKAHVEVNTVSKKHLAAQVQTLPALEKSTALFRVFNRVLFFLNY